MSKGKETKKIFFFFSCCNLTRTYKVPDTITSFLVTGISQNCNCGLGITDVPSKLTVFKQFFIVVNLPYKVIRGETVCINVIVYNYDTQSITADVTFFNTVNGFDFIGAGELMKKKK
jgi:hypothetical protein